MDATPDCCGGIPFAKVEPSRQAAVLSTLAHDARLLQFSLECADPESERIGDCVQRALELAMEAEDDDAVRGAVLAIEEALADVREAGMTLSARLDEALVEGAIGTMKMPVLSTVLAPQR
jgi:hypothetical protein